MSLTLVDAPAVHQTFAHLVRILATRGRGSNLRDLGTAYELAQALEAPEPDAGAVDALRVRLGLLEGVG